MNKITKLQLPILILVSVLSNAYGQELPKNPVSYRIFSPFIFNPAIAGSKDFSDLDMILSSYGKSYSATVSGNFRVSKSSKEYISSPPVPEFTNFGVGAYIFNDRIGSSDLSGVAGTVSYHLQIDKNALSFLSFGLSVKAAMNKYPGDPDLNKPAEKAFFPEADAGIYYYSPLFYAGISADNLLGNPGKPDSLGNYIVAVSRQLYFNAGYKIILNRSLNIILEPTVIFVSDFTFSESFKNMIKPGLKLYSGNFCVGTYFNDLDKISFHFQYKYSKLYLGTYFELAYNKPFFKNPLLAELAIGINLSAIKSGYSRENHW